MRFAGVLLLATSLLLTGCSGSEEETRELPGGTAGTDLLTEQKLLVDGRLQLARDEPTEVPVHRAMCSYLFGTPEEVGATADLPGEVTFADGSGYRAAKGDVGRGFVCGYAADGQTVMSLVVWTRRSGDTSSAAHVVQTDLGNGLHGLSAYVPDYDGPVLDGPVREDWLRQAGQRVDGR